MLSADKLVHTDHLIYDKNNYVFHLLIFNNIPSERACRLAQVGRYVINRFK